MSEQKKRAIIENIHKTKKKECIIITQIENKPNEINGKKKYIAGFF